MPEKAQRPARARLRLTACVAEPGNEAVVETENVSREGLCFRSAREYVVDTFVRVAVPYTPEASNIFLIGRVCWVNRQHSANEYGINYVTRDKREDVWAGAA